MNLIAALNAHPWLLSAGATLLGLAAGSFLNVVIARLPVMLEREDLWCCRAVLGEADMDDDADGGANAPFNLMRPGSHCPRCRRPVRPLENIPLLSYLALGGRCRGCKARIPWRYPIVEALSALLALALARQFGAADIALAGALLFTWMLIPLAFIDLERQLLPDRLTLPLLWLGLLFNLGGVFAPLPEAVLGAAAGYGALWLAGRGFKLATGREGMGGGDCKLLAALGAWLGWHMLPLVVLAASLAGLIIGGLMLFLQRNGNSASGIAGNGGSARVETDSETGTGTRLPAWRDTPIAFGPYLAAAGWAALFWGQPLRAGYWGWFAL